MAGLPDSRAMVWVGPPLSARVPSPGLLTPTLLPLTPLLRPPLPPALERLPVKVQLRTVSCAAPVSWKRPPPLPVALLLEKVLLLTTLGVAVLVLELIRPPP